MQSVRTAALIARLKQNLVETETSQVALAKELGLSPQNLSLILRGINNPNAETTLAIEERLLKFLQSHESMTTTKRPVPKSLAEAKEQLEALNQQQQALESRIAEHKRLGHVPKTDLNQKNDGWQSPGPKPTPAAPLPVSVPKPPAKVLPDSCNTPFLLGEYLKVTSREDLVRLLESTKDWRQALVYTELKTRP
jgi:transcriptional regulator with XRE-family HTH domain